MRGDSGYAYLPAEQAEVEFGKYEERIKAVEKLNATLPAEIDLMRPVVNAVLAYGDSRRDPTKDRIALLHKIQYMAERYETAKEQQRA